MKLSQQEQGAVAVIRILKEEKKPWELKGSKTFGRLKFSWRFRSGKCLMGRFGGGWNYELGFQLGGSTILIMLLLGTISFTWLDKTRNS